MKPHWSILLLFPNMICIGLGIISIIKPEPLDPHNVGWMMVVLGLINFLYVYATSKSNVKS